MQEIVNKQLRSLKRGILNLVYKEGLLFEKSKENDKFRETFKIMQQLKLARKVLKKYLKLEVVINLKQLYVKM